MSYTEETGDRSSPREGSALSQISYTSCLCTVNQVLPSPEGRNSQRMKQPGKGGQRAEKGPGLKESKMDG